LGSIKNIPADRLVWVDECGVEENTDRLYGRACKGKRVFGEVSGKHTHRRVSVIAAYVQKKLIAPFRFKGYTNAKVFEIWLEACLLPLLIAGQIVILDNATFHKAPSIRRKIEAVGASVRFLPPYSPDINKIEPQWAVLKARLRNSKYQQPNFLKNLDQHLNKMSK
jgi:transposase